jgi:two-component system NtrC family sensor kinase
MTIRNRIIIAVFIQAAVICIICIFVYWSFTTVLSKLRAIEIIDDVNISLLEIRKSEKNYFLYHDLNAMQELFGMGEAVEKVLRSSKADIVLSVGQNTYDNLSKKLNQYLDLSRSVIRTREAPREIETQFRSLGHELTSLSEKMLRQERKNVSRIISSTVITLLVSLGIILLFQLGVWQYFFHFIIKELAIMANLIQMVSKGRFHEVAVKAISPKNEIDYAIKAISDMANELEKREAVLLQSEKLAGLGVLISGVAHELGNPLNNISLMAQAYLSLYDILGDNEKKTFMADVLTQTDRISKIINNLLDFSRQKKPELQEYDPREIVERSLALVSNQMKISNVKLLKIFADSLPRVYVDAPQIEQVLVNLYINAIAAMPEGGELTVAVEREPANRDVLVKVKDTGVGIPKEVLPHIFDPFFTTKGTKGTGLGLSVSYGIIRQHHGKITVESEAGQGTTFLVRLPAYQNKGGKPDVQENPHS